VAIHGRGSHVNISQNSVHDFTTSILIRPSGEPSSLGCQSHADWLAHVNWTDSIAKFTHVIK
jgi:hypothetical protein